MSIIRLSCKRAQLFAPSLEGNIVDRDYDPSSLAGRIGTFDPDIPTPAADLQNLRTHLAAKVATHAANLAPTQPVVVLVHGFLFDPFSFVTTKPQDSDNPHGRLYHFHETTNLEDEIRHHTTSWPRRLGFAPADNGANGLCIAFGWHSSPGIASSLLSRFQNYYARAYDYGTETAWVLIQVLNELTRTPQLAGRRIDIFCHSLGSHVVTRAIALAAKDTLHPFVPALDRVILLGGAEYVVEAQLMYRRVLQAGLKPGDGPTFYNVGCRENDVLDKLGEHFGPTGFGNHNVIGHNGLGTPALAERWMDLQIDSGDLRDWLKHYDELDVSGDQPGNVWDHWYYYTHPGNMEFYRRLLRERDDTWTLKTLRAYKRGTKKSPIPEGIRGGWLTGD
jgi:hypothetical protein